MEKPSGNYSQLVQLLFLFLLSSNLFSQTNDSLEVFKYDSTIVISATRTEKKASDVSRSLSIITKEVIDNSVYLSPAEILAQKEGISIIGNGQNPGAAQNIFMRGVNSNSTAVMIDGVRITDPSSIENSINFSEMSLMNIERIEVIRGAHSTLYGSSAIGGVINFISEKNRATGFNVDFSTQAGVFGNNSSLFNQNLFLNYTFKNGFYLNGELFNSKINGQNATINNVPDSLKFRNSEKDNFEKLESSAKIGFINNYWDAFISYKNTDQKTDIDDGAFADDDNYILDFERALLSYNATYKINDYLKVSFLGGYSDMNRKAIDDSSLIDNLGNYDQTYVSAIFDGSTSNNEFHIKYKEDNLGILLGAGLSKETMTSNNYIYSNSVWGVYEARSSLDSLDLETETQSLFTHFDINGALLNESMQAFNLAFGGRYLDHSTFGKAFTFEVNPSYKFENALLYGSVATGYNAPSLYRLYTPDANFSSGITRGNANLKPEKSFSQELGFKYNFNENHSFFAALFNNEISDIHEYVYLWNGATAIDSLTFFDDRGDTYINAGTMTTMGVEFGFISKIFDNVFISGNASLLSGKQKYSINDADVEQVQGHHVQVYNNGSFITKDIEIDGLTRRSTTANLSITFKPQSNLIFNTQIRHVGKRDDVFYNTTIGPYGSLDKIAVSDYTIIDISTSYRFISQLKMNVRIENILNKKYSEIRGYSTRGRGLYLGLNYSL
ncbi:MAG: TonB-dependent receptor [Calditrichaeota bacterium]|nr:MAG: TonB-dependent receptor [Calditrichota bacterium]MBL1206527.1 TonB-dependent receptor [Calditrichota bacterium]NOG46354.1 TonB-dependent receptor [Calditrichota bacterium]